MAEKVRAGNTEGKQGERWGFFVTRSIWESWLMCIREKKKLRTIFYSDCLMCDYSKQYQIHFLSVP